MPKVLKVGDKLTIQVVDGYAAQPVVVRSLVGGIEKHCDDDMHCACHGGGPFFCCRCGTEFDILIDVSDVHKRTERVEKVIGVLNEYGVSTPAPIASQVVDVLFTEDK